MLDDHYDWGYDKYGMKDKNDQKKEDCQDLLYCRPF